MPIKKIPITLLVFVLFCWMLPVSSVMAEANDSLPIAVAGPLSGPKKAKGMAMLNGIMMAVDQANSQGGINGKKIAILPFDDYGEPAEAARVAKEIAASPALLVLGHRNSDTCVEAGKVYRQQQVPAITGTAIADEVTKDNDWYFRIIFTNAQQGTLIAYYIHNVLGVQRVNIIHDIDEYGRSLTRAFENTAANIGLEIGHTWALDPKQDEVLGEIVTQVVDGQQQDPLFLATHDSDTVLLVKELREALPGLTMIGGASIGKQSFPQRFAGFAKEQASPGFYTDGLYASTYFLYDVANQPAQIFRSRYKQRFNSDPDAQSVASYDIACLALDAMTKAGVLGQDTVSERQKIREALAARNTLSNAFDGLTGPLFFDKGGNAVKSVPMAVFLNQKLISAPQQLAQITNQKLIARLDHPGAGGAPQIREEILEVDSQYLRKTKVVYAGVKINEISDLDLDKSNCRLDFYLWFRFHGKLDVADMEFLNAAEPEISVEQVDQENNGQGNYRLYRVHGKFRMDFLPGYYGDRRHVVGISLRHRQLSRDRLILVNDTLSLESSSAEKLASRMSREQVLSSSSGWRIKDVFFFQDTIRGQALGHPEQLAILGPTVGYSRYNAEIIITRSMVSLRGILPDRFLKTGLWASLLMVCVLIAADRTGLGRQFPKTSLHLKGISTFLLLIAGEDVVVNLLRDKATPHIMQVVNTTFDLLWWLVPAILLNMVIERLVWNPLERKARRSIPNLLRRFVAFIIFLLTLFGIFAYVYDQKITSLLASTGVIAMILGLAVQINIANIFSGIAINLERPFRVGDWVKIGDHEPGWVRDITWRTTRIETTDKTILSIPNSMASESAVRNYAYPDEAYRLEFVVQADPAKERARVKKIITDVLLASREIDRDEPFSVRFQGFVSSSAEYLISVSLKAFEKRAGAREKLISDVWKELKIASILPGFQAKGSDQLSSRGPDLQLVLDEVDFGFPLSGEAKKAMIKALSQIELNPGQQLPETVAAQDLVVIGEGVVAVLLPVEEMARREAGRLATSAPLLGSQVEQSSLEILSGTVFLHLKEDDLITILGEKGHELLCQFLKQRHHTLLSGSGRGLVRSAGAQEPEKGKQPSQTLLHRMALLFSTRHERRTPVKKSIVNLMIHCRGTSVEARLVNISKGGMSFTCEAPERLLEPKAELEVQLQDAENGETIACQIRYEVPMETGSSQAPCFQYGVKFTNPGQKPYEILRSAIRRNRLPVTAKAIAALLICCGLTLLSSPGHAATEKAGPDLSWLKLSSEALDHWSPQPDHQDPATMIITPRAQAGQQGAQGRKNILALVPKASSSYSKALSVFLEQLRLHGFAASVLLTNFGKERQRGLAALKLAEQQGCDLIFSMGSGSSAFLHKEYGGGAIPVVTCTQKDPVALGQMPGYEQGSGTNIAYTSLNVPLDVQMRYLLRLKPALKNIGLLYNRNHKQVMATEVVPARSTFASHGLQVMEVAVESRKTARTTLEQALPMLVAEMRASDPDLANSLIWVTSSTAVFSEIATINRLAGSVPVLGSIPDIVQAGDESAVLAIGIDRRNNAHLASLYAIRILSGQTEPGTLKVGVVTPPDVAINFKIARKIGLKIPFTFIENAAFIYDYQGKPARAFGLKVNRTSEQQP